MPGLSPRVERAIVRVDESGTTVRVVSMGPVVVVGVTPEEFDAETASRVAGDATNATAITAEAAARVAGDAANATAITTEATARGAADTALSTSITAETSARSAADVTLSGVDTAETAARTAGDAALQLQVDALAGGSAQDDTARAAAATAQAAANAAQADIDALEAAPDPLGQYQLESEKGQPSGYASLGIDGKVPVAQLPASVLGNVAYQGVWNAATNTPDLGGLTPTKGWYYVVSVAGSTSLGGFTEWGVKDWAIYNGAAWEKVDNTDAVNSVAGKTGTVTLQVADLTDSGAFGRSLVQAVLAGDARTLLGLVIGSTVQAYSAVLGYLGGLTPAADRLPYFDGATSAALATFTSFGRTLLALTTVLTEAVGGTGQTTYTLGDLLYASAANTLSKLAGNTTTARKFLRQVGNGSISAGPAWDTLVAGDIPDVSASAGVIGTILAAIAAAAGVGSDKFVYFTGATAATFASITASGRSFLGRAVAVGDLIYGSAADTWSILAGNTATSRKFLVSQGNGSAAQAPVLDVLTAADLPAAAAGAASPWTPGNAVNSGLYYLWQIATGGGWTTTLAMIVGTPFSMPHLQEVMTAWSGVVVELTTAGGAGKKYRVSVHYAGADGLPAGKIWSSILAGTDLAADVALGLKPTLFSAGTWVSTTWRVGANLVIPLGQRVWLTIEADGTPLFRAIGVTSSKPFGVANSGSWNQAYVNASGSWTFSAGSPDPYGAATLVLNRASPAIAFIPA